MDLEIRLLEDALIELVNASQIPIEAKRLVIRDVLNSVEVKASAIIQEQLKEKSNDVKADNS